MNSELANKIHRPTAWTQGFDRCKTFMQSWCYGLGTENVALQGKSWVAPNQGHPKGGFS